MTDWKKDMAREAEGLEWSHKCGWEQGVRDAQAAYRDLRARYEDLQLVVPTFATEFDALLEIFPRTSE